MVRSILLAVLRKIMLGAGFALLFGTPAVATTVAAPQVAQGPPSILFGQLFRDVQLARIFPDQKTFCDLIPDQTPEKINAEYAAEKAAPNFSLAGFVATHFRMFSTGPTVPLAPPREAVQPYIAGLWNILEQRTGDVDQTAPYSSLIELPYPYVVPGGRFREVYYWDSYFTMLGLEADGRNDIVENMIADFAYEIDTYGHIPNGNRTYYLSRSQPPFFSKMIDLLAEHDGPSVYVRYLRELRREYDFWMQGADQVPRGQAFRNVVHLTNGLVLNRYWDERDVPRDESYYEDVTTAMSTSRPAADVYRNLRATAESGWDFSSRWLADGKNLATVQTLSILPVDLNSLLEHLESTLALAYALDGDRAQAWQFKTRADVRKAAIRSLFWDSQLHLFEDYSWQEGRLTHRPSAAALYPLFFDIATREQADKVARLVAAKGLEENGVATTLVTSGQQWDQPNGWAPLQWIAVSGFRDYGQYALAKTLAQRWINVNLVVFNASRKLVEKYDLLIPSGGSGGEYATQIGFGWTNGVLRKLMTLYP
jgi:alpha,alpha-trehalase